MTDDDAPVRVVVADDHAVMRHGLTTMVEEAVGVTVVAQAADGDEAVATTARHRPDVVLMDVRMPGIGGIEAARRIVAAHAGAIKVLMVTTFDLDADVLDSLRAGASGFVLKDIETEDLASAIRVVQSGDSLLAPSAMRRLIARFVRDTVPGTASDLSPVHGSPVEDLRSRGVAGLCAGAGGGGLDDRAGPVDGARLGTELSEREREIVAAVARGLSNAEIAVSLHLAHNTVKSHISNALTKWGLRDRVQLVVRAFETGLVTVE